MEGFRRAFELIAQFPGIGRPAGEFRRGLRRYRYESNYIFFTVEDDHILIREIFHTSQNISKEDVPRVESAMTVLRLPLCQID